MMKESTHIKETRLLVFTDLDGTLLDEDTYEFEAAKPALEALRAHQCQLVLNSSKTYDEIFDLCQQFGYSLPFGFENGSAIAVPNEEKKFCYEQIVFGWPYHIILQHLHELRESLGFRFRGFSDMTTEEVVKETGLSFSSASMAKNRRASEPLQWQDTDEQFNIFRNMLSELELKILRGGRFFHVASPFGKDHVVKWFNQYFRQRNPHCRWISIGLGDAQNDISMLEETDEAVLIRSHKHELPVLERGQGVLIPNGFGPEAWNEAILTLMEKHRIGLDYE